MNCFNDRKAIVTTLGATVLGLGLMAAAAGSAPGALAQEESTPAVDDVRERFRSGEKRGELYAEFTAALAAELGIASADDVDAAIRVAMMTLVDARVDEGLLTAEQAEALKTSIATSDVPLGPGPLFGPSPGAFLPGGPGRFGPGHDGRVFPGRGGHDEWTIQIDDGAGPDQGAGDSSDAGAEGAGEEDEPAS